MRRNYCTDEKINAVNVSLLKTWKHYEKYLKNELLRHVLRFEIKCLFVNVEMFVEAEQLINKNRSCGDQVGWRKKIKFIQKRRAAQIKLKRKKKIIADNYCDKKISWINAKNEIDNLEQDLTWPKHPVIYQLRNNKCKYSTPHVSSSFSLDPFKHPQYFPYIIFFFRVMKIRSIMISTFNKFPISSFLTTVMAECETMNGTTGIIDEQRIITPERVDKFRKCTSSHKNKIDQEEVDEHLFNDYSKLLENWRIECLNPNYDEIMIRLKSLNCAGFVSSEFGKNDNEIEEEDNSPSHERAWKNFFIIKKTYAPVY